MVGVKYESDQSDSSSIISSATDDSDYEIVPRYAHPLDAMMVLISIGCLSQSRA